jgi:membrane-bound serine protease (ClpP class)
MIGEALTPGIGILGIGGVVAFLVGSLFLFEGSEGGGVEFAVSLPLVIGATLTTAVMIFGIVGAAVIARRRPLATGGEQLVGSRAAVVEWQGSAGSVRVTGEIWAARADRSLQRGDAVRVVSREGLVLIVEP